MVEYKGGGYTGYTRLFAAGRFPAAAGKEESLTSSGQPMLPSLHLEAPRPLALPRGRAGEL